MHQIDSECFIESEKYYDLNKEGVNRKNTSDKNHIVTKLPQVTYNVFKFCLT